MFFMTNTSNFVNITDLWKFWKKLFFFLLFGGNLVAIINEYLINLLIKLCNIL